MAQNRWEAAVAEYKSSGSSGSGKAGNSSGASNRWDAAVSEYKKYGAENYKAIGERRKLEREIKSTTTNYVKEFTKNENAFYSAVNNDFEGENGFNAAEYFEERQKQASALKAQAAEIYRYFEENADSYDPEYYYKITEYLTGVDKSIEETMSRYQPSLDSKAGMAAYEDEYIAAMERNAQMRKNQQAATFGVDPMYQNLGVFDSFFRQSTDNSKQAVTDNWTAEQRYNLGHYQNTDPAMARKYAELVNAGKDPFTIAAQQEAEKASMLAVDLTSEKKEIDRMKAELENIYWNSNYDATSASDRAAFDQEIKRREKEISDREQKYNLAKRAQESEQFRSAADRSDFDTKSRYIDSGFTMPAFAEDADPDELVYEYINNQNGVRSKVDGENISLASKGYDLLSEDEVALYNYYYATEGPVKAQQYLDNIQETLNYRMGERIAQSKSGDLWKQYLSAAVTGYSGAVSGLQNLFNEDEYIPASAFQQASGMIREDLAEAGKLPEFYGDTSLGQIGYDLISTTANMAPSIMLATAAGAINPVLGKVVGSATMGASAAGNAYQQALNNGYTKEQARTYAALTGASEAGLEYVLGGISKLGGEIPQQIIKKMVSGVDNAIARAAITLGGSMASEGFEEGLQEVITPWIENLTLYADKDVNWDEVAYSTLLGALSGGFMEGPGVIANTAGVTKVDKQLQNLGDKGNTLELAELIVKHRSGEQLSQDEYIKLVKSKPAMQILEGKTAKAEDTGETVSESAPVEKPKVSSDGKAIQISTNEAIETLDFASLNKGKATVQLKNGETADYSDVSFASEADANQFYAVASLPGIDTENANDLLHTIQEADAGKDVDSVVGIREAYGIGYFGMQESDLESGDAGNLTPELRNAVFDIGRQQRTADAMVKATAKPVAAKPSAGYKKVVFEGKTRQITEKGKAEIAFVDYIADNFSGNTVHVFESYKGRDGKYYYRDNNGKVHRAPNGKYVNGEIWLDLKAGNNQEGLVLNTFAHEMYHHIEKFDKAKAQELAEFVVKELGKKSVDDAVSEQIKKARKAGLGESYFQRQGMTAEQARNEVYMRAMSDFVADSLETMFTRGDPAKAIANLKKENRTLFDEIKAFIDKWVSKVKEFYKDKTISKEGEMVAQLEKFEQLQQLFMEAVQSAGENYRAALSELTPGDAGEIVSDNGEADVKYSDRDYLAAVKRGDTENAQRMVDEAAKKAGYNSGMIYHGTPKFGFTWFDLGQMDDGISIFATSDRKIAESYSGETDRDTISDRELKNVDEMSDPELLKYVQRYIDPKYQIATESQRRSLLNHYVEAFDTVRRDLVQIAEDNPNAFSREGLSKLHEMADIIDEMSRSHDVRKLKNLLDKYTDERASLWKRNPAARELMERDYGNALGSFMNDFIGVSLDNIYGNIKEISNKDSLFVTNEANSAEYLPVDIARKQLKKRTENGIYGLYAKTDNLFEFDANGEAWNRIDGKHIGRDGLVTTREVAEYAKKAGYNGVKIRNLRDAGGRTNYYEASDIYTLFDSAQVKSADTVTYDDSGNVIPLSERFNEKNADIRYSYRDTNQDGSEVYETGKDIKKTAYKDEQKKLINDMLTEQRVIREELTGKESDITIMEREFIRLAKKYEQMDTRTGKSSIKDANTIAKLKADLRAEAKSHRDDSKIWEREFNRLLRDYETSGRQIARLEATIQRQRSTAKARVEGRRKTEMRHKIQRKANEMNRLLIHGTKHRNIPEAMQPAVADILKAINMEVRDGEQRRKTFEATVARYDQQIALATDPLVKEALIEKRDNYVAKGDQFANKMAKLQAAYKEIQDNKVPNLEIDEGLASQLDTLFEKVGDTPLGQMTMAQLEAVNDVLNITNATITNANKLFQEGQRQGIEETSKSAMREVRSVGGGAKKKLGVQEAVEAFNWNNQKPIYAFEAIGSNTLTSMFKNLRKGEDTLAVDLQEGKTFFQNQWKKHKGKDWDMEKKWKFTSTSGKAFELDLNQIMSLYALSKRDQARDHLRVGGFSFDSQYKIKDEVKVGPVRIKAEVKNTDASAYNLSDEILGEIIGKLTTEQRAFVDEMQAYLSDTMAAKGNEISMKKYGIRLFKEKNYFPLRVSDQYMARAREQQTGDRKLKNSGFTKETTPNAKNPVVLSSFTEVWAEHVDEMSLYHSFVLPLDDMSRVLNYHDQFTEETAAGSVVEAIRTAYGEEATKYIEQLIRDVNGGARSDSMARAINNMMSKAKKAQTMASLSVAIQQPSAILRACSMVDGKYFLGRKVTEKSHNSTWEEIKAHAPIAIIKEMGGFDTNVGKSTTDYLTDTAEYDGFGQQFKALFTDSKFRDDAFGKLPAMMDEMAWGAIWNAVKREQADKHPSMDVKSDAFMKLVADRFTDVIVHTQVYDSVFSRSGLMRSKDTGVKMATAFMAEPTTTINMLQNAILQAKRGEITGKDAAKTVGAIVSSLALNAALVSVVYAIRDDDEDKRLDEKWIENFHENFFESLDPRGYIPLLRDLQNKIRGFDVERADMTLWGDLINAFNGLQDEKLSALDKWEAVIGSVGNLFGIPLKNIIRESKGVIQTFFDLANDEDGTLRIVFNKEPPKTKTGRYMAAMGMDLSDGEELLLAIQRGDDEHIQRVGGRFENQQKAESALQSAIREKYKNGDLTREEAEELLTTNFDRDGEHDVYWILDEWDYAKENGSSDGYAKFGNLYEAIENGGDYSAEMDRLLAHGSEESEIRSQITRNYHKQYLDGDETARQEIRDKLMPVMEAAGMDESDIADKFNSWDFEAEYGMTYSEFKSEYRDGNVTEAEMRDAMKAYGLLNYEIEEDIRSLKDGIRFKQKYDMSLSEMKDAYDDGDISRNQMTSALVFSGMTKSEAQKWVKQREIENRLGIEYAKLDDAYKHNDISRTTLYNAMIENGATKQEADDAILGYDWLKKNVKKYPDMAISDAKKFAVRISTNAPDYTLEDFGVKVDDYIQYSKLRPDCKGVDNNGDGQADSGTKRNAIFKMIDSLPISSDAKDGLALIDYGMNSILKNAPWH